MRKLKDINTVSDLVEVDDDPVNRLLIETEIVNNQKYNTKTKRAVRLSIRDVVFRQYNTGTWVAAFRNVFSGAQFYLGAIQFAMVASLAYDGNVGAKIRTWMPWMSYWHYMAVLAIAYLFLMLFEWKVVYPSLYRLSNQQGYKHDSPIKADFDKINARLSGMEQALKELNDNRGM